MKASFLLIATAIVALSPPNVKSDPLITGLSDPQLQPFLVKDAPNAFDLEFDTENEKTDYCKDARSALAIEIAESVTHTSGLENGGTPLNTRIYGHKLMNKKNVPPTWPGPTIVAQSDSPLCVMWKNMIAPGQHHIISPVNNPNTMGANSVVDTTLHWAYSLPDKTVDGKLYTYSDYTIFDQGVPVVTHLHGGHTVPGSDGNPEYFFSKDFAIKGPRWEDEVYRYDNDQPAATLWYHDHALGLTRLNVYAGLAGFYILYDDFDTGDTKNKALLPHSKREHAFAIQDRMFKDNGELFYPAFPGDPEYEGFIDDEGAILTDPNLFPFPQNRGYTNGGPTALPEFFGDHFVVNGVIWPKYIIEQTGWQRIRLLNGCDSRFLVINFVLVADQTITGITGAEGTVPYHVIGTDQGLVFEGAGVSRTDDLVIAPGNRYDIVINFPESMKGKRVIVTNNGGDAPFRGLPAEVFTFPLMKTIMAFDIGSSKPPKRTNPPKNMMMMDNKKAPKRILRSKLGPKDEPLWVKINDKGSDNRNTCSKDTNQGTARVRRVALFEGTDEYGRLQPLLGTAEPATDFEGKDINWPEEDPYNNNGLTGSIEGTAAWHTKTTENPALGSCEEWEIWNVSADAHPVHLHLVHFEVVSRHEISYDTAVYTQATATGVFNSVLDLDEFLPQGDGIYVTEQPIVQHNGEIGSGRKIVYPNNFCGGSTRSGCYDPDPLDSGPEYVETGPMDVVTALPNQVTKIRMLFDRPGRYVWHCHILSHEDHEMMRVLHVGPE